MIRVLILDFVLVPQSIILSLVNSQLREFLAS